MTVFIPTAIEKQIRLSIRKNRDFHITTESQNKKLFLTLIELWSFILDKQTKDESRFSYNCYTQIPKKSLERFKITINKKRYKHQFLLNLLSKSNLISINDKYSNGAFCKSYRINTSIINNEFTEIEIDFEKVFHKLRNKKSWLRKYPQYKKQIKEAYEVTIELGEYVEWLRDNEGMKLKPIIKNGRVQDRVLDNVKILEYLNDALKINYKNLWFSISSEGRFYNSLTNISYTSLPFVRLKKREIKEIDVKNCQPLLLASIIKNDNYKKDVENGVFYERMGKELGKTRSEFKMLSYQHIFFSNRKLKKGAIYNAMEKLYPGLITQINTLRDEKHISRELQTLESEIMVDKIGSIEIDMMLRHDAVFVHKENVEEITELLKAEFDSMDLNVTIK